MRQYRLYEMTFEVGDNNVVIMPMSIPFSADSSLNQLNSFLTQHACKWKIHRNAFSDTQI